MAVTDLHPKSVRANSPATLHDAAQAFEDLAIDLNDLSSLTMLAALAGEHVSEPASRALRAIEAGIDRLRDHAEAHSARFLAGAPV